MGLSAFIRHRPDGRRGLQNGTHGNIQCGLDDPSGTDGFSATGFDAAPVAVIQPTRAA